VMDARILFMSFTKVFRAEDVSEGKSNGSVRYR
jgi:hypothetical protein